MYATSYIDEHRNFRRVSINRGDEFNLAIIYSSLAIHLDSVFFFTLIIIRDNGYLLLLIESRGREEMRTRRGEVFAWRLDVLGFCINFFADHNNEMLPVVVVVVVDSSCLPWLFVGVFYASNCRRSCTIVRVIYCIVKL